MIRPTQRRISRSEEAELSFSSGVEGGAGVESNPDAIEAGVKYKIELRDRG